jgi:hypothetical protein
VISIADLDADFAVRDHDGGDRRERRGITPDRLHVSIARDRPEPFAVGLVVPVDRIVLAQPGELIVRLTVRERRR